MHCARKNVFAMTGALRQ